MKSFYGMDLSDDAHVRWTVFSMVLSLVGYVLAYKILRRNLVNQPQELCCRIVTFLHGIICCLSAVFYVVLPALGYYKVASIPFAVILSHSMGYFFFDLCWCFIHGETPVMKFHHLLTCTGLVYYSFKISKQYFIVYALGLTEITNPFLQVRWFLKHQGMRDSFIFMAVETLLIAMFFIVRVIVLSYYTYLGYVDKSLDFDVADNTFTTLGLLTGYALSIQMFNYIRYQLRKSKKKRLEQKLQ